MSSLNFYMLFSLLPFTMLAAVCDHSCRSWSFAEKKLQEPFSES
jgi:hypothetical protein